MAATFSDWINEEVVPKLDILSEALSLANYKEQHLDRLVEQISRLGIKPYHFWAQEHAPSSTGAFPASGPAPGGSLSNRGGVALEGILEAQGVKWNDTVKAYMTNGFLEGNVWGKLNEECRRYGFRWNKDAKGWMRQ